VAQISDSTGTTQYLHADLIGSTRQVTSSAGAVVSAASYDAYGGANRAHGDG
jgi:hypothetical protein